MSEVLIVQRVLPHYRVPFFERLSAELQHRGHRLRLLYGQEYPGEVPASVQCARPWATRIDNRYFAAAGHWLAWQPVLPYLARADLLIVEQSNKLLANYALQARLIGAGVLLAYWGHGRNRQAANAASLSERLKRRLALGAHWWFAYTDSVGRELAANGYPRERITVVDNAIDEEPFREAMEHARTHPSDLRRLRLQMGPRMALYCGGLRASKRLDFLLAAADRIRRRVGDFQLAIIGDGPERIMLSSAAASRPWLHVLGAMTGVERVPWFLAARAQLMPGVVGLGILDSFITQCPLITTDIRGHGPEIDYLSHGTNGIATPDSVDDYTAAVVRILTDDTWHARLEQGCAISACRHTLRNMVDRFATGVSHCLESRRQLSA